jgi:dGTPase
VTQKTFLDLLRPLCEADPRCPALDVQHDRDAMLDLAGIVRSVSINTLIHEVADVFQQRQAEILDGSFDDALVSHITSRDAVEPIQRTNIESCYSARDVLKLELTGSVAIQAVMESLIDATISSGSVRARHLKKLIPGVFIDGDFYSRVLRITDFVAGMTDHYVVRLYRELSGIRLPGGRD